MTHRFRTVLPTLLILIRICVIGVSVASAQATETPPEAPLDPVFDVETLASTPLNAKVLKKTQANGIVTEEVMFHSEMDGEKSIDIFALFSYKAGAKNLPAYVWNQGGLAQATDDWTVAGAGHGYAVLCIDFPMPKYRSTGNWNIVAGLELPDDPRDAPIYHGAVALLKAVSYLETRPEVDKNRIGMAGMSWGGFYSALMAGIDPRIKAATCMYGSGGMHLGNIWWDGNNQSEHRDAEFRERWRTSLDPAARLAQRKVPIAWFTGTNDWFYWMPAVMHTYARAAGPKHLSVIPNWDHALPGNLVKQMFTWLDVHLKGEKPFNTVGPIRVFYKNGGLIAQWSFKGPRPVQSAQLILSYGEAGLPIDPATKRTRPGTPWNSRCWITLPAKIEKNTCSVALPDAAMAYYIGGAVWDQELFQYSTPLARIVPTALGLKGKASLLPYNGAASWGSFEPNQLAYIGEHLGGIPEVDGGAHGGQYCAVLGDGRMMLPTLFFTSGVAHEFTAYLRANKSCTITAGLEERADGKTPKTVQKSFKIGEAWTPVRLRHTPAAGLAVRLEPVLNIPKGIVLRLDDVQFRPVAAATQKR